MVYGVILAGGVGSRMGGEKPKQYLTVKNKPIIIYTIEKFFTCPEFEKVIVLCPEQYRIHYCFISCTAALNNYNLLQSRRNIFFNKIFCMLNPLFRA